MKPFHLEIVTPEKVALREQVTSLTMPTVEGEITVLADHVPLVAVLKPGELRIHRNGEEHPYALGGGFVEVDGRSVTVLADTIEHLEEIDERLAEEARARGEKLKSAIAADDLEFARMAAKLERDLNRLRIVRKYRHRGHHGITQEGIRPDEEHST